MEKNNDLSKTKGLSLGAKLVLIISTLVFISLVSITFLVQFFMSDTTSANAEITTLEKTNETASTTDPDIAAVIIPEEQELINTRFFISNEIESELVNRFLTAHSSEIQRATEGETFILNAAPIFELQVLAYLFPWREGGKDQAVIIFFSSDSLSETYGTSTTSVTYLINGDADILIHPDIDLVMAGTNVSKEKIIEIMNSNGNELHQQLYEEDDGTRYFGAYKKLSFGNLAVITNIERNTALKSVNTLTWQNIYLTLAVLFITILFVALYSKTISKPVQALTAVAQEINQGNFNTELFENLKSKRTDEIGVLIQSTKDEREILNTVSRLTNKGVAKAIVRKEIDFEPHLKDITIFFSDIRGFTAISDGFNKRFGEKSAAEIISFLNDYMSRMVNCITISGGNVDKFEGDAIMACWGVLRDENLETPEHKKHVQEDAINAVRGVLAMRYALMVYNKAAEAFTKEHEGEPLAKYKPHIRIGSGLNSGRATVGFMGSYDKMEFTSIGDAVNLASRTESSNKPCGTDMLITEDTYNLLKYDYIKSPENNYTIKPENLDNEIIVEVIPVTFEVKGKGKQHFYGVVNMPRFDIEGFFKTTDPDFVADPDCICAIGPKGPRTLAEVRTLLGIPTPDFSGVNLDAEESKVKAN